jgi:hypothetical protein
MAAEFRASGHEQGHFRFRKPLALALLPCMMIPAGFCIWLAWDLSYPEWHPIRRGLVGEFLLMLPWWMRGILFTSIAAFLIVMFVVFVFHALDRKPDFIISSDGISRNFLFRHFRLPWSNIRSVSLRADWIMIEGVATDPSKRGITIEYSPKIFGGSIEEVLTLIRRYRPDLITKEQIRIAVEPELSIHQIPRA